jgi:hypothetical protein
MRDRSNDDPIKPSQEELDALLSSTSLFSFQSVRVSLDRRSPLFKWTWLLLMGVTILYLMGWFTGLLKPYMASAVTGLEADYQLHQVRFLLAFILITVGTVALNFDWHVEEVFTTIAWIQAYFLVSGVGRQWRTMPEDSLAVILIYAANLLLILMLLVILISEERRLKSTPP